MQGSEFKSPDPDKSFGTLTVSREPYRGSIGHSEAKAPILTQHAIVLLVENLRRMPLIASNLIACNSLPDSSTLRSSLRTNPTAARFIVTKCLCGRNHERILGTGEFAHNLRLDILSVGIPR